MVSFMTCELRKSFSKMTLLLTVGFLMGGCRTMQIAPLVDAGTEKFEKSAAVMISVPRDGVYGEIHYGGSGTNVAMALEAAFLRHVQRVVLSGAPVSIQDAIGEARLKGCGYLVVPRITHWEDRATEWSGLRDKMSVIISVFSVTNGVELRKVEISGKSSWFTFGGDHPQDLLELPCRQFVDAMY